MAVFGLPGGAEWLIIIGALVLLFVPGAAVFGLGYLLGRKNASPASAAPPATHVSSVPAASSAPLTPSGTAPDDDVTPSTPPAAARGAGDADD